MRFSDLKVIDPSIRVEYPETLESKIIGISPVSSPVDGTIVFVKEKRYFEKLETILLKERKNIVVLFDRDYWIEGQVEDEERWRKFLSNISGVISSPNVDLSISLLSKPYYDKKFGNYNDFVDGRQMGSAKVHPSALIAQGVFIGENVTIGQNVKIYSGTTIMSGSIIDDESVIFPNVTIYYDVKIGKRCRVHAGTVIGADGFGYNYADGKHHKIWHLGSVIIHDDVELGANVTVDSGTFAPTIIKSGTKIDNQVQIAHNCELGVGVIMCGQAGLSGSGKVGDFTIFGGKAGMADNVAVGKGCQVAGGALINCDWPDGSILGGHPARDLKEWMRGVAFLRKESLKKRE